MDAGDGCDEQFVLGILLLEKRQRITVAKLNRFFRYNQGSGMYDLPCTAEYIRQYLRIKNVNRRETIRMSGSRTTDGVVRLSVVRVLQICDSKESAEEYRSRYKQTRLALKPPGYMPAHIPSKRSTTAAALDELGEKSTEPSSKARKLVHESSTEAKTKGKLKGGKQKAFPANDGEMSVFREICAMLNKQEILGDATQTPQKCTSTDDNVPTNGNALLNGSAIVDKTNDVTNEIVDAMIVFADDLGSAELKRLTGEGAYSGDVAREFQEMLGEGPEFSITTQKEIKEIVIDTPQNVVKLPETSQSGDKKCSGTSGNDAAVGSQEEFPKTPQEEVLTYAQQYDVKTPENRALSITGNTEKTPDDDATDDGTSVNGETNTSAKSVDDRRTANSSRAISTVYSEDWPQTLQGSSSCTLNNTVRIRSDKFLPTDSNIFVQTAPYNGKGRNGSKNSSFDSTPEQQLTNNARERLFNKPHEKQEPPKTLRKNQSEPTNPPESSTEAGRSETSTDEKMLKMMGKLLRKFEEMQSSQLDFQLKMLGGGPAVEPEKIPPADEQNMVTIDGVRFDRQKYVAATMCKTIVSRINTLVEARWNEQERLQLRVSARVGNEHLTTIPPDDLQKLLECCAGLQIRKFRPGGNLEDLQRKNLFRTTVSSKLANDRGYAAKIIKGYKPPRNKRASKTSKKRTKVASNTSDSDDEDQKQAKVLSDIQIHNNQRQCEETAEST